VLRERAGEPADVSSGGVGGHRQLFIFTLLRFCHGSAGNHARMGKAGRIDRKANAMPRSADAAMPGGAGRLFHSHKSASG
jgi:hypothetical protein